VDVAELFNEGVVFDEIEVVVARLPYVVFCSRAREALFDDLDCRGEWVVWWFGEDKMHVVRHDDIAEDFKEVFCSCFFKDVQEGVSCFGGTEDRAAADTDEVDGVVLAGVLTAL